uniref:Uncharacterized protein n=1 Tax=Myripristis murdjan TaxID=586833 RepID=A0A667WRQ6_9TELE
CKLVITLTGSFPCGGTLQHPPHSSGCTGTNRSRKLPRSLSAASYSTVSLSYPPPVFFKQKQNKDTCALSS